MKTNPEYYFKKINEFPFPKIFETKTVWDILETKNKILSEFKETKIKGTLGKNVFFENIVIVEEGAKILHNSVIEGPVYIGKNSIIGPNAYIRKNTMVGNNCKIGCGEVKGSIFMNNARADHSGYIGDSVLGDSCHIGAGVVTANLRFDKKEIFDGVKKFGAVFGDNTEIGSNSTILPGTLIGSNVWIYPGAIVKNFVPENSILKYKHVSEIIKKNE